jgi:hypothetical protein
LEYKGLLIFKTKKMANKTKKEKGQGSAEGKTNAEPPAPTQPPGSQPQAKKNKGCLTCGIIAIIVVVLLIIGFIGLNVLSFWFPPTFLFGFLSQFKGLQNITSDSGQKGALHGKNLAGLIDPSKTVTKRIRAKDGGQITVQTASGSYFTLDIGPGSLSEDTDISLTPADESPIEDYDTDDPGVIIGPDETSLGDDSTVTVSEDPPTDPGDSGADSGTSGDGGTTTPPGTPPPGTSGDIPDLGDLTDLLGGNTITTTPSGNSPGQGSGTTGNTGANRDDRNTDSGSPSGSGTNPGRFSDKTVIIFVGYGGIVTPVPTDPSEDGGSVTGPINETGGTAVDDPDEGESEDLADNAATASGGDCTPEFMQAMAGASRTGGAGSQAAQAALRNCLNTEWLNNLCVNDPVKLRRKYFEQRIALARRFDERAAGEIESLMNQCQARYHFHGEGINPQSAGGVTIFSSLDASVCGYVDDKWTGNEIYTLNAGPGTYHTIEGTAEFNLPAGGGPFSGTSHGSNDMDVIGRGVAIPNFEAGFTGTYDGYKTLVNLTLYPAVVVTSPVIELQEKPCAPIAPLPH